MCSSVFLILTILKFVQFAKAPCPIILTLLGIVISLRFAHYLKVDVLFNKIKFEVKSFIKFCNFKLVVKIQK